MTITHQETFTVTDRATGRPATLAFGIENGMVVCQGPKSWQADVATNTDICAGHLLVTELANHLNKQEP